MIHFTLQISFQYLHALHSFCGCRGFLTSQTNQCCCKLYGSVYTLERLVHCHIDENIVSEDQLHPYKNEWYSHADNIV